jgi:hypothetical protein
MVSPDIEVAIEDEVAEGEKVVTSWMASGTPASDMRAPDRPDDEVRVSGISIFDFSNGAIRRISLRFQSHDDYPRPIPKEAAVRERLDQEPLLDPLGVAWGRWKWKCFFLPWTCHWAPPDRLE